MNEVTSCDEWDVVSFHSNHFSYLESHFGELIGLLFITFSENKNLEKRFRKGKVNSQQRSLERLHSVIETHKT